MTFVQHMYEILHFYRKKNYRHSAGYIRKDQISYLTNISFVAAIWSLMTSLAGATADADRISSNRTVSLWRPYHLVTMVIFHYPWIIARQFYIMPSSLSVKHVGVTVYKINLSHYLNWVYEWLYFHGYQFSWIEQKWCIRGVQNSWP